MQLNNTQRKIIIAMIIIMVGMLLFPPFHVASQAEINLGYSFLFSPPDKYRPELVKIDALLLLTQWFGVLSIGALLVLIFNTPHKTSPAPDLSIKPIKTSRKIAFIIILIIASICFRSCLKYESNVYKHLNSSNLEIGHIEDGYRYKGGDPSKKESWELLPPKVGDIEEGYRYKGGDPYKDESWEPVSGQDKTP